MGRGAVSIQKKSNERNRKLEQMTSRTARSTGSKLNDQLFSARSVNDPQSNQYKVDSNRGSQTSLPQPGAGAPPASQRSPDDGGSVREQYGIQSTDETDPLQLEHLMGFCGNYHKTVLCMPHDEQSFVRRFVILHLSTTLFTPC